MFWYLQISNDSLLHSKGIVTALIHFFSTILFANQCTMPSMWYMSMILIVYLMIPVIAIGVKRIGNKLFYILALVAMMSGMIVPNINTALNAMGINKSIDFAFNISDVFSIYFLYILAGYWIGNDMFKQAKTIRVLIGFIICFIGTAVFQMWIYSTDSDYYVRYADIGVLLSASFLFELVKRRLDANDIIKRLITYISKISFGIYFVCLL